MKLIDRYIARLYLINVLTLLLILGGFIVTVDVFVNLSRFTNAAAEAFGGEGEEATGLRLVFGTVLGVANIWGPRLLQLFNYLIGVVLVAGMGFTCTQLVRHRELVAMLAGGVSLHRIARPFAVVALMFIALQAVNQEVLVPSVAHLLTRDAGDVGRRDVAAFPVRLVPDDEGRLFHAEAFVNETQTLRGLHVFQRSDAGAVTRVIEADAATWDGRGWALEGGIARTPWASGAGGSAPTPIDRLDSTLDPAGLKIRHLQGYARSLGFLQISRILEYTGLDERSRRDLERMRWGRLAGLAGNLVTLLAALPFFLVRLPQPMISASLKAAPVAAGGLVAAAAAPELALPGLPIWLGAFVPCLLLLPIAVALFSGLRT